MNRISLVQNHLHAGHANCQHLELSTFRKNVSLDTTTIRELYLGKNAEFYDRIVRFMANDAEFKNWSTKNLNRQALRKLHNVQMRKLLEKHPLKSSELNKNLTILSSFQEAASESSGALGSQFSTQFSLYARTIMLFGTEKHQVYLERALEGKDTGSFLFIELAHASNLKSINTRADYDPKKKEITINTLEQEDMKIWGGNAGKHANMCIIWAQLHINDRPVGIHPFLIQIRSNDDHSVLPGVTIGDFGMKIGLDGVDNCFMLFKDFKVGADALLDRYSSIDQDGNFKTNLSPEKLFNIYMNALSFSKISGALLSLSSLKSALIISTRFSYLRKQFGSKHNHEIPIMDYPLTQFRIFPYLSVLFALKISTRSVEEGLISNVEFISSELNINVGELSALASFMKVYSSWFSLQGIQEAREICGAMGLSSVSRLPEIRDDASVFSSEKGENNHLISNIARFLIVAVASTKTNTKNPCPSLYFLNTKLEIEKPTDKISLFEKSKYDLPKALEQRALYLLNQATNRMIKYGKATNFNEVFNKEIVYHLKDAVIAYGELYIYNQFSKSLKEIKQQNTLKSLTRLLQLCGLYFIEKDIYTFIEMGYIRKADIIMIKEKTLDLCHESKKEGVTFTDSISIPDELIRSEIGKSKGNIYDDFFGAVQKYDQSLGNKPEIWNKLIHEQKTN